MCAGVVPQHPPTMTAPDRTISPPVSPKVLRRGRIVQSAPHVGGQPRVRLGGKRQVRRLRHPLDDAPEQVRADAAVRPPDEDAALRQRRRHLLRGVSARGQAVLGERQLHDERQPRDGPDRIDGDAHVPDRAERLEQDQVRTGIRQDGRLLREDVLRRGRAERVRRAALGPERTHRPGDPGALTVQPCRLARERDRRPIQLLDAAGHPVRREPRGVRAERVGLDQFRPRPQVVEGYRPHRAGPVHVRQLRRSRGDAVGMDLRAHRSVGEQRTARETFEQ